MQQDMMSGNTRYFNPQNILIATAISLGGFFYALYYLNENLLTILI